MAPLTRVSTTAFTPQHPSAFRATLHSSAGWPWHLDWGLSAGGFLATDVALADLGNLATKPREGAKNRKLIESLHPPHP